MTARASSVIEFPAERLRRAAPRAPGQESAEVVIFTGVRIERLAEETPEVSATRTRISPKGRGARR
jgi:hypothetical protein